MNEQDEIKYILATSTPKNDNKISPQKPIATNQYQY